jgi:hypothetical protein
VGDLSGGFGETARGAAGPGADMDTARSNLNSGLPTMGLGWPGTCKNQEATHGLPDAARHGWWPAAALVPAPV